MKPESTQHTHVIISPKLSSHSQDVTDTEIFSLSLLFLIFVSPESTLSSSSSSNSIQNLLQSQGLPGGIFPHDVKSFTLHPDGLLEVLLDRPCLAKFDTIVNFDRVVRANLTYGKLVGMEGLSQKELFLWLPVKDIIVDNPSSGVIVFDIGDAYKHFSLSLKILLCVGLQIWRFYSQILGGRKWDLKL